MVLAEVSHRIMVPRMEPEQKPDIVYPSEYNFPWDTDHLFFNPGHVTFLKENTIYPVVAGEVYKTVRGNWLRLEVSRWLPSEIRSEKQHELFFQAIMKEMNQLPYSTIIKGINGYTEKLKQKITSGQEHQYLTMRSNYVNEWYIYFIKHSAAHNLSQKLEDSNTAPAVPAFEALKQKTEALFKLPYDDGQAIEAIRDHFTDIDSLLE